MFKSNVFFCIAIVASLFSLQAQDLQPQVRQIGEDIQLLKLTENVYIHRSFKVFDDYGRVASNGIVYITDGRCIIFDTPVTLKTTTYLLDYLQKDKELNIQAVVANHFHSDCIAGLDSVHARGIPSYGSKKTIKLALEDGVTAPQKKFGKKKTFEIGSQLAEVYYPGPAHSIDNVVAYIPSEKVLFGGCMLKSYGASKGNIADANIDKWPKTIAKVKKRYPEAEFFVPGHGHSGGIELMDYTIDLFSK